MSFFGLFIRFKAKQKRHGRRAMVKQRDEMYEASKFEFDARDGRGVQWQRACSNMSVEKSVALFLAKGYTIVGWDDDDV